ncbi:hypothetical protein [Lysinibacillus fusiformis]|uniref:hypothetical protein n=1 Tax=Lysinibacillus fusiformis TaxID=28031 RepID=UPI00263AD895|nr:hypothetical protein [Lysinibacillus fusiformis]MDC6267242.1 hypothetical protein [Lysinibacillus sphaericus]MDN4968324.1 hypothetical protein [Lysinibacillus fusiformis]MDN4968498.1 hypothetical protein [Lysinibacillus fusiformis]
MIESPLEKNEVQLTSKHRLSIDKYNKTLSFKYQKRGGKGKNAPLVDEYGYNNEKHFGNFKILLQRLAETEFTEDLTDKEIKDIDALIIALKDACKHIDKVANEMYEYINDKITIDLGDTTKGRGRKKSTEEEQTDEVDAD